MVEISSLLRLSNDSLNFECTVLQNNRTFLINGKYEGIPENLLINVVGWVVLLLLFTVLRKVAWDYGRIALIHRNEENLKMPLKDKSTSYNVWTTLFYGESDPSGTGSQDSLDSAIRKQDTGFFGWIPSFFRIKDTDILRKCGVDAIQYIRFQRYLLVYIFVITVLSIAVILPINIQGSNSDGSKFGDTTISNLHPGSPLLWLHTLFAVLYLIIAVVFMRHFTMTLNYGYHHEEVTTTLMVSNIPKESCFKSVISQHFEEAYPECQIIDIQFAYNISKLIDLDYKRQKSVEALRYSEITLRQTGRRLSVRPYTCGIMCCCDTCGCNERDAIEYYGEKELEYRDACENEKPNAFQEPLGIAFITFNSLIITERIHSDFSSTCKGSHNPQPSSVIRDLKVLDWSISYAPSPENIYWENLSFTRWRWWLRAVIINLLLFVLLFFFTTPAIVLSTLDEINYRKKLEEAHSAFLVQFIPTVLLWLFSSLLPNVVYYSDQFVGHWTKSSEHHSVMRKSFVFLLIMVLVLPSLGLTSARAFFEWAVIDKGQKYRWRCIFLAGNGAFFVNYIITSAFIGTALELLRFSQLFMYLVRLSLSGSIAEKSSVRKAVIWDFQFGIQYAWMLCVFAIIVCYSIPCPLVTPFGLLYLGLRYVVDRYNIYYSYAPSRINKHIHSTAVTFVITTVILLQFTIMFFAVLRTDKASADPVFLFSALASFISLLLFVGKLFFRWFRDFTPTHYQNFTEEDRDDSIDFPKPFVPGILQQTQAIEEEQSELSHRQTYGTTD